MTKQTKDHLKICCFFHKLENSKVRKIFNNTKFDKDIQPDEEPQGIFKTSVLTLQRLVNNNKFLLNVLQYELQTSSDDGQLYKQPQQQQRASDYQEVIVENTEIEQFRAEIETISNFHREYTLSDSRSPSWWRINFYEVYNIEVLVAKNKLEFPQAENIDCKLMRIISLHWNSFNIFRYTIKYDEFVENLSNFKNCIVQECFIVTRYMHMFRDSSDGALTISMILIAKTKNCFYFCNELMGVAAKILRITNFDTFIDICYDLSHLGSGIMKLLPVEDLQLYDLSYNNDVLAPKRQAIRMTTETHAEPKRKTGFNIFFSPVSEHAKLYFYSQTRYGCIRVFDRVFQKNNLANFITDVIYDNEQFFIHYSSAKLDENVPTICIRLRNDEMFATEAQYRKMECNFNLQTLSNKKLFFIDFENIKMVVPRGIDEDSCDENEEEGAMGVDRDDGDETTIFPYCLLSSNIRYRLSPEQITTYKVVQYHREKLLLQMNNIPQINFC